VTAILDAEGVLVDAGSQSLNARLLDSDKFGAPRHVNVDGRTITVWEDGPDRRVALWEHRAYRLQRPPPLSVEATAGDRGARGGAGRLTAPMPGRVVNIAVAKGQHVVRNQPLIVMEAMKMEHVIQAPHAGIVAEVCVREGEHVSSGAQLMTLGSE
jgi:3-methylcrotonyl-CoA carboxylase alpha subunit